MNEREAEVIIDYIHDVTDKFCEGRMCDNCPMANKDGDCVVLLIEQAIGEDVE